LASAESSHRYIFTDVEELDIVSRVAVEAFFEREKVDVVVNCAAYTAVDLAEEEEPIADNINHRAVALLAEACKRHNATLIHISTDYIFDGKASTPYTEESTPAPINTYGLTKWAGEQAVAESGCRAIILRTQWLYSEYGRNFCKTMLSLFTSRDEVRVVADQMGTPTYAGDLAEAICNIIESGKGDKCGIYHYSNRGEISWCDFARAIVEFGGAKCRVSPCTTAEYGARAPRPAYSVLDTSKICRALGCDIPEWRVSLAECIKKMM
jgi:dTDP-4-dehydrorhamnose reductase